MSSELWLNGPVWLYLSIQHPLQEQHTPDSEENSEEEVVTSSGVWWFLSLGVLNSDSVHS